MKGNVKSYTLDYVKQVTIFSQNTNPVSYSCNTVVTDLVQKTVTRLILLYKYL